MKTLHQNSGKGKFINTNFFVLDVETNGLFAQPEYFIFACLYGYNTKLFFYSVDEIKKELLKGKYKGKYIFVHNAEFDLNVIYGNIIQGLDNSAVYNGSSFIMATNEVCKFADSLNIYKTSVKEIGKIVGLEKLEIEESYKKGKVKKVTDKMREYCARDCNIVFLALQEIFNFAGSIKPTLASLALALYKNKYLKFDLDYEPEYTDLFFNSYYGGRTEAFKIGKTNACYYDVNSMYPWAMLQRFPNPKKFKSEKNISIHRFLHLTKFYEGLAHVKLFHVEHFFGFLPYKSNNKLLFPNGNFEGWYNLNELRFAIENKAIEIKHVYEIHYSTEILDSPFTDYVNELYEIKNTSSGIEKTNAKLFLNSLYGKFAEKAKAEKTYYEEIPLDLIQKYESIGIEHNIIMFNAERIDCYIEIEGKYEEKKTHVIPLFSSYITSYSRIRLLEYMLKWQKHNVVYCDTDSIMLENEPNYKDSNVLGEFKREKEVITEIKGLKNYTYTLDSKKFQKLKGVPKNAKQNNENEYEYIKLIKAKSAIRRKQKTGMQEIIIKNISNKYDKRIICDKFGNTKAIIL
jgi:hypothetical protein